MNVHHFDRPAAMRGEPLALPAAGGDSPGTAPAAKDGGGSDMQEANTVYMVRFWIKPGGEDKVLDWLDNGHIADVVSQPGFLWARRYRLEGEDADGWAAHAMIYGLESMDHLHAYFESDAARGYGEERETLGLAPLLRMDRAWGVTEFGVDA